MQLILEQKQAKYAYSKNGSAKNAVDRLKKGSRIIGLTQGQFSLIDLIHETLTVIGGGNVILSTWSAGIKDVNNVKWMCDTKLIDSFLLIVDHSYATRQKNYVLQIGELFSKENIRTSEIHAKFVLIWNDEYKISIRTSMNLNANKTCETYEIEEGEEAFKFYHDFAMSIAKEMPSGFVADSSVVTRAQDRAFNFLQKDWFTND